MFREWCNQNDLAGTLLSLEAYHPFPTAQEREPWEKLPAGLKKKNIGYGEEYLGYDWPSLPAVRFMDFIRDGNRSRYEALHFARRRALARLVVAECMEGKGRFLDDILNGIWCLCEESFWGVPAHNSRRSQRSLLPDVTEPIVDLFAAETAGLLAWTCYLLKQELDGVSPLVTERIRLETKRRILDPYLEREDFGWMGYHARVNNWNPWINSNCLTAFLLLEEDKQRRVDAVSKILYTLDFFLAGYHPDGGCDEGTSYWGRAGASLFDCLEQLYAASEGKINFYDQPIVKEIGRFIYRSHIAGDYFINFADGGAKIRIEGDLVYRYGKRIGDPRLTAMGSSAKLRRLDEKPGNVSLLRELPAIFQYGEIIRAAKEPCYLRDVWMDGIQVMAAREREGSCRGLYLAAKGGNNNESHNHNDVGQFIVYADGKPVLIDVGVETYTRKTFSPERYDIWTMQSAYHNLPAVNGIQQAPGEKYHATDVVYRMSDEKAEFSLEISPAYPKDAGMVSWNRKFLFHRAGGPNGGESHAGRSYIEVTDTFRLEKETDRIALTLMTCRMPHMDKGVILLEKETDAKDPKAPDGDRQAGCVRVEYDSSALQASSECIPIKDARLKPVWGDRVYRILFRSRQPVSQGSWTMRIQ